MEKQFTAQRPTTYSTWNQMSNLSASYLANVAAATGVFGPAGFGAGYSIWLRFTKAHTSNIADDMLLATPSGESSELLNP
jgi:hypothetical protein